MVCAQSDKWQTYHYRHLTHEQCTRLSETRRATDQLENSYTGYFLLTQSEYALLLPLLNPLVIAQTRKHMKRLCSIAAVSPQCRRKMQRNVWLQSAIGFIPIVNVVFTRKFKCNGRNLRLFEKQMQEEEDKLMFMESTDTSNEEGLPTHITRLFDRCPVVRREQQDASGQRSAAVSMYYSPCMSLSELLAAEGASSASVASKQSDESVASTKINPGSSANLAAEHKPDGAARRVETNPGWAFAPATQPTQWPRSVAA